MPLGLCLLLLVAPTGWVPEAAAQYFGRNKVQYDQFRFDILPADHFDIYFYDETETAIRDVARMADRWHARHSTVFAHELTVRRPLIFYANDADFQQTNVIGGEISQGVGGVTEGLKQRVVMPLTGLYADTDHVLGHELVHSFPFDLALSAGRGIQLQRLPLWLVEGMAEYLSIGSEDPYTAMWLRDALVRDDLPTIRDLSTGRYFPYRFGQAYMAYIGHTYGDRAVTSLYQVAGQAGLEEGLILVTGMTPDSLSADWIRTVTRAYGPLVEGRTPAAEAGRSVLSAETGTGSVNVSPALSPDGRYVAFLSSRDLFSIDLYVADAETGEVIERLGSSNRDAHFDAIRFLNSAGTWSPDGRRFAFVAFADGDNELAIWNVQTGRIERRVFANQLSVLGAYPLQNTRRFEVQTGLTRYGFDIDVRDYYQYPNGFRLERSSLDAPDPVYFSQSSAAYVVDYSNFGFTSPVQGGRYRLQVGTTLGSAQYATVLADLRQYVRTGPVTLAGRVLHIGNYGAEQGDIFSSEYLGYSFTPSYLRGYSFNSFDPKECFTETGTCAALNRLVGTRVAVASAEVRVPFFGTEQFGLINFPYLPTELSLFVDAGVAWTAEEAPVWKWARDTDERVPVVSTGVSARMNLFGSLILEVFYAQPYQRPEKGGFIGVNLLPGW